LDEKRADDSHGDAIPHVSIAAGPGPDEYKRATEEDEYATDGLPPPWNRRSFTREDLSVLLMVVYCAVTIGLFYYAMRGHDATDQFNRLSLRAWVGPDGLKKEGTEFEIGKVPKVTVRITNKGKTPAVNMRACVLMHYIEPNDVFADYPLCKNPDGTTFAPRPTTLFPDVSITTPVQGSGPLRESTKIDFDAGVATVFVYGWIGYDDIYGKPGKTGFCYRRDVSGDFSQCTKGNTAE